MANWLPSISPVRNNPKRCWSRTFAKCSQQLTCAALQFAENAAPFFVQSLEELTGKILNLASLALLFGTPQSNPVFPESRWHPQLFSGDLRL